MPRSRLGLVPLVPVVVLALVALIVSACGKEKPSHGLKSKPLINAPKGAPVQPGFAVMDGETYTATIEIAMRVQQITERAGRPNTVSAEGRAVVELVWTLRQASNDAPITSTIALRYLQAEGANAAAYLKRDAIRGTLRHDKSGRAIARSLSLHGGTTAEQLQAQDLIVSMLLAGFGGSYPWTPPREIRVGEAWRLEKFIKPRAIDNVRRYARETGLQSPEPTFEGTGRLEGVLVEDGERWLDLQIEALIDMGGRVAKGGETARVSIGDRVTGTASVSMTRGVPRRFEVTHARKTESHSGQDGTQMEVRSTIRGTVVRTPPAK